MLWIDFTGMKVSEDIKKTELGEEFRVCPACGYELGFHSTYLANCLEHLQI